MNDEGRAFRDAALPHLDVIYRVARHASCEPEARGVDVPEEALAGIDRASVSRALAPSSRRPAAAYRPDGPAQAQRFRGGRDARLPTQHRALTGAPRPPAPSVAAGWGGRQTLTCPEQRVVDFLAGELSDEDERRFDDHLLVCEQCWRAVRADRVARLALEQLRQPAPAGLQDRVTLSVAIAADEASKR